MRVKSKDRLLTLTANIRICSKVSRTKAMAYLSVDPETKKKYFVMLSIVAPKLLLGPKGTVLI